MLTPRKPTNEEVMKLEDYLSIEMGCWHNETDEDRLNIQGLIEGAGVVVFDKYITDCPGYSGKVMLVVWPGSPNMHEAFTFDNQDKLIHINQDEEFRKEEDQEPF